MQLSQSVAVGMCIQLPTFGFTRHLTVKDGFLYF